MFKNILNGFQSLHFDTLTLNSTNKEVKSKVDLIHRAQDVYIIC